MTPMSDIKTRVDLDEKKREGGIDEDEFEGYSPGKWVLDCK